MRFLLLIFLTILPIISRPLLGAGTDDNFRVPVPPPTYLFQEPTASNYLLPFLGVEDLREVLKANKQLSKVNYRIALRCVGRSNDVPLSARLSITNLMKDFERGVIIQPTTFRILSLALNAGKCELCSSKARGIVSPFGIQCCGNCEKSKTIKYSEDRYLEPLIKHPGVAVGQSATLWQQDMYRGTLRYGPILTEEMYCSRAHEVAKENPRLLLEAFSHLPGANERLIEAIHRSLDQQLIQDLGLSKDERSRDGQEWLRWDAQGRERTKQAHIEAEKVKDEQREREFVEVCQKIESFFDDDHKKITKSVLFKHLTWYLVVAPSKYTRALGKRIARAALASFEATKAPLPELFDGNSELDGIFRAALEHCPIDWMKAEPAVFELFLKGHYKAAALCWLGSNKPRVFLAFRNWCFRAPLPFELRDFSNLWHNNPRKHVGVLRDLERCALAAWQEDLYPSSIMRYVSYFSHAPLRARLPRKDYVEAVLLLLESVLPPVEVVLLKPGRKRIRLCACDDLENVQKEPKVEDGHPEGPHQQKTDLGFMASFFSFSGENGYAQSSPIAAGLMMDRPRGDSSSLSGSLLETEPEAWKTLQFEYSKKAERFLRVRNEKINAILWLEARKRSQAEKK